MIHEKWEFIHSVHKVFDRPNGPLNTPLCVKRLLMSEQWLQEETYKTLSTYGSSAIKTVLLLNGGAVLSLLTFLGNFLKNGGTSLDMAWPMGCFLTGIILGSTANILAYFTQLSAFNSRVTEENKISHWITDVNYIRWFNSIMVCIVLGVLLFCVGAFFALLKLQSIT